MPSNILPSIMLALFVLSVMFIGQSHLMAAQAIQTHAQPLYTGEQAADAWVQSTLTNYAKTITGTQAPLSSDSFGPHLTGTGYTATATLAGVSAGGGATQAANVNSTLLEERVAVDITVSTTTVPILQLTNRYLYRIMPYGSFVEFLGIAKPGTTSDTNAPGASDTGGCAGTTTTGAGCDQRAVQVADPQIDTAYLTCKAGVGSGTCPGNNQLPVVNTYTNSRWTDTQSTGP
jgi:hypothetical protein